VLPFLTYGNEGKMSLIISHFEDVLDFVKFDADHGSDDDAKMEAFVALCDGIERNAIGNTMKSQMIETGVIEKCLNYLLVIHRHWFTQIHYLPRDVVERSLKIAQIDCIV
jgi:E3 ubiquitin-protein ligase UBR4